MAKGKVLLTGLIGGAIAGAVAGLVLAPRAGKEVRDIVREKGGKYLDKGEEYISTIRDRIRRDDSQESEESAEAMGEHRGSTG